MRGRFPLGVILILALLLGLSSLGLNAPPRAALAQFTLPVTDTPTPTGPTPTDTATIITDTPTSTQTASAPTSRSTSVSASASPTEPLPGGSPPASTRRPGGQGVPATPSLGIKANNCARVVRREGLNLGQGPGFDFGHVQIVGANDIVFVLEGPQRGDGLWWWKVVTRDGVAGWGINDHLLPETGACFGVTAVGAALAGTPTHTATRASQAVAQLPATGLGDTWLWFAAALVAVLLVAGFIRRRNQRAA